MKDAFLPLLTDRLVLRGFRHEDLDAFTAYRSDPAVARYQTWDAPYSRDRAVEFMREMRRSVPGLPGEWYQVAIERQDDGALLGDCAFCILAEDERQAEIGFTLARAHQGRGYATEAVRRLLDHLFDDYRLHRVRAICDVRNAASAALLERLGLRREACTVESLHLKGGWASEYWYAILRREWTGRRYKG